MVSLTMPQTLPLLSTFLLLLLLSSTALLTAAQSTPVTTVSTITIDANGSPAAPTNDPSYVDPTDFRDSVLNSTNTYRAAFAASPLAWNTSLEDIAAPYSQQCEFRHSGDAPGENLAEGYANVTAAIEAWGNEVAKYDFSDPGFAESTGHFTQLVWAATATVGCGATFCNGEHGTSGWLLVCEYWPRGNVIGQFGDEVHKANGTIGGSGGSGGGSGSATSGAAARMGIAVAPATTAVAGLMIAAFGMWAFM